MSLMINIKKTLKDGGEKALKLAEDISGKIKEVSEEGLELSKELLAEISEKSTDVKNMARLKMDLNDSKKRISKEMQKLGEQVFAFHISKSKKRSEDKILSKIEDIEKQKKDFLNQSIEYENLRKEYS